MIVGTVAAVIVPIVALQAPTVGWLFVIFVLTGISSVCFWLVGITFTLQFGSAKDRPAYVGLANTLTAPSGVLAPLLGILDPRRDTRIQFVGGIRGHQALSAAVDRGEAALAFHLYPTGLDQLFAVADTGQVMPPKSTWFEPKLRGGVLVHRWDEPS